MRFSTARWKVRSAFTVAGPPPRPVRSNTRSSASARLHSRKWPPRADSPRARPNDTPSRVPVTSLSMHRLEHVAQPLPPGALVVVGTEPLVEVVEEEAAGVVGGQGLGDTLDRHRSDHAQHARQGRHVEGDDAVEGLAGGGLVHVGHRQARSGGSRRWRSPTARAGWGGSSRTPRGCRRGVGWRSVRRGEAQRSSPAARPRTGHRRTGARRRTGSPPGSASRRCSGERPGTAGSRPHP